MLALRNLVVVLVEDDPELARTVERVLARYGHTTTLAASVASAEALPATYDCAVLDIDLPDGSGVELARRLLEVGRVGAVVFFSASSDPAVVAEASELGPFVPKAAGTRALERAIAEATGLAARQVVGGAPSGSPGPLPRKSGFRRRTNGGR